MLSEKELEDIPVHSSFIFAYVKVLRARTQFQNWFKTTCPAK